jgi:DNA-directed RNA polymerase subunit RPC12/RpoP
MATIAISCPKCEKQIKAPAELAGKKIRCMECKHVFVVKGPAGKPADKAAKPAGKAGKPADKAGKSGKAAAPAAPPDDDDANPYSVTDHEFLPRCAYCAKEMEEEGQVVCLNCGYNHRTRERPAVAKTMEPTGGEWFIHLLPGIICALVVLSAIGGIVVIWTVFPRLDVEHDAEWWNPVVFGLPGRIWNTVITLFIGFLCGRFAVKRLIFHTRPPERAMQSKKKD